MKVEDMLAEIEEQIRELVPEYEGAVTLDSSFEEIGVDSLSRVDLVVAAERAFEVEIPDSVLPELSSVRNLIDFAVTARQGTVRSATV
jgi:acyl carrier protein